MKTEMVFDNESEFILAYNDLMQDGATIYTAGYSEVAHVYILTFAL